MSYQLVFHPKAEEEYFEAYLWYEDKQEGLGYRFEQMVEQRLKQISEHPEYYTISKASFREVSVEGFPFKIVYKVQEKKLIYVAAIYHTKRNPKNKYRRKK